MNIQDTLCSAKRVAGAIFRLLEYGLTADEISLSISQFSTPSAVVREGEPCQYSIQLANNTPRDQRVKLRIDISWQNEPRHPSSHYVSFEKAIFVKGREKQQVKIGYDWERAATFVADQFQSEADRLQRGLCRVLGVYVVTAMLFADEGKCHERVSLSQQLVG